MRLLSVLFIALISSNCAHEYAQRLDSGLGEWVGKHPDRLVESWGAPNSSYNFENGSKALTYENSENYTRSFSRSFPWRSDVYSSSENCRITFFTDATQKKIERFNYKGYPSVCLDILENTFKTSKEGF